MGRKINIQKPPAGLVQREGVWHISKRFKGGGRLRESTGTSDLAEAEKYLHFRLEQVRQENVYGVRPMFIWREAATRYLTDFMNQPSIKLTATYLKQLDPFIGDLPISHVRRESLQGFVDYMKRPHTLWVAKNKKGEMVERLYPPASDRTINIALQRVTRILTLCHDTWHDDQMRPLLDVVPKIANLSDEEGRKAYPMTWEEQKCFFAELPAHLQPMALFKVNTGCREQEVCKLRWEYEQYVPELGRSVFVIPRRFGGRHAKSGVKNREVRVVILNDTAQSVIEGQRGKNKDWVFPWEDGALHRMNDHAWRKARARAARKWEVEYGKPPHEGFAAVRVHDMKHTFGRRLKAAGVSLEDRKCLLGHKLQDVTELYSSVEMEHLVTQANKVSLTDSRTPTLTILRERAA